MSVFDRLFRKTRRTATPAGSMAAGLRVYAIGDIHGRLDLLDDLLARIDQDDAARASARTIVVVLGDVVDRGPDSAGVIDRLLRLKHDRPSTRFLMGNHEEMLLAALAGEPQAVRAYCRVGGRETLLSYGLSQAAYERMDYEAVGAALAELVADRHRRFLAGFEDLIVLGDYAFVHAGIDPAVPLSAQKPRALRWIRQPFLAHRGPFEKVVVHGHTVNHQIECQGSRIGIDTGAYETGVLSALCLEGHTRTIIQT